MIHINDIRSIKEFKNITFSKYKKSSVKEKLIKSINSGKLEESCYWSAEFICSGNMKNYGKSLSYLCLNIYILEILNCLFIFL